MTATEPPAPGRRLLGLAGGAPRGSAEILLKAALMAAEAEGAQTELVRIDELALASNAPISAQPDLQWLWERVVAADALVIATPIMTRTIAAGLKTVVDRMLGPNADAAIVEELIGLRDAGTDPAVAFRLDPRVLKPRVAGFIAVGGSLTPQWQTLALPMLHTLTMSMQIAVVDQVVFGGAGMPRAIVLDEPALARSAQLGRAVATQIGRPFDQVVYRGDSPGLCPMCHLDVIVLTGSVVDCATCGARGALIVQDGAARVHFTAEGCRSSVLSMHEKRAHFHEIQQTGRAQGARRDEIEQRAARFDRHDRQIRPEPVQRR